MIDVPRHTAEELRAIREDAVQIDPDGDGYLTEEGQHISDDLYDTAGKLLPIVENHERYKRFMNLQKLTYSELQAIRKDVVQIDPDGDGYLTEEGQHISDDLYDNAVLLLPMALHRKRSAKGGRGYPPKDKQEAQQAITRLFLNGHRPTSFKAIYQAAGIIVIYERHDSRTMKNWIEELPIWRSLPEEYRNRVSSRGRRPN